MHSICGPPPPLETSHETLLVIPYVCVGILGSACPELLHSKSEGGETTTKNERIKEGIDNIHWPEEGTNIPEAKDDIANTYTNTQKLVNVPN